MVKCPDCKIKIIVVKEEIIIAEKLRKTALIVKLNLFKKMKQKLVLLVLLSMSFGRLLGYTPPCMGSITTNSKPITITQFDTYYNTLKNSKISGSETLPSLIDFKSKYSSTVGNNVNIYGFNFSGSLTGYSGIKELSNYLVKTTQTTNPYGPPLPGKFDYKIWGITSSIDVLVVNNGYVNFNINLAGNTTNLRVDFDDDRGDYVFTNGKYSIKYNSLGKKTIKIYWEEPNLACGGNTKNKFIMTKTIELKSPVINSTTIVSANKVKGLGVNKATYDIYNGNDGVFDKPIIVAEGYDFLRVNNPNMVINQLTASGLYKKLYDKGYDLVIVRWETKNDYLENNAQALKSVINDVNKKSNKKPSVLLGMSMGGVISRIALKEMENANLEHHVRLYISYDAPHNGADVPLGYQKLIHDIAGSSTLDFMDKVTNKPFKLESSSSYRSIKNLKNEINSNAAKQLLIYHYNDSDKQYNNFQNTLKTIGFPVKSRNVSISCGNLNGRRQYDYMTCGVDSNKKPIPLVLKPGERIYYNRKGSGCLDATFEVFTSIPNTKSQVSKIVIDKCIDKSTKRGEYSYGAVSLINSPGGYIDLDGQLDGDFKNCQSKFSFVSSASALAIKTTDINYNSYLDNRPILEQDLIKSGVIPFDKVYSARNNNPHVFLHDYYENTQILSNVIDSEIFVIQPKILYREVSDGQDDIVSDVEDKLIVSPNPTSSITSFEFTHPENEVVQIQISNSNGTTVLTHSQSNTVNLELLPNGIYFYHVISKTKEFRGKLIKN